MSFVQNINGKFEKITEASWYKILMPKLYGWGAAVVILGALFKIENLPGAGTMLMIGLGLESIIFFFSASAFFCAAISLRAVMKETTHKITKTSSNPAEASMTVGFNEDA